MCDFWPRCIFAPMRTKQRMRFGDNSATIGVGGGRRAKPMRRVGSLRVLPTSPHTTFKVSCSVLHGLFDAVQFQPQKITFPPRPDTRHFLTEYGMRCMVSASNQG